MPKKMKNVKPPTGFARLVWRAPIWLYKLGLGGLLKNRFMLLNHTGRKSGLPRQNVLEIIRYDEQNDLFYVASGFGEKAAWFRNITANPSVTIQTGNRRFSARARQLSVDEAVEEMSRYYRVHPKALENLSHILGYELDGTEEDARAFGRLIPLVVFTPDHPA